MKKIIILLLAGTLLGSSCTSPGLQHDCLARKQRVERVAAAAAAQLKPGWTAAQVRALLGDPDEIVAAKGLGDFDIWKYYLWEDCKAQLGESVPETELFFLDGNLVKWTTVVR